MKTAENIINHVKDAYFWLTEKVSDHPHVFVWAVVVYMLVRR